MPPVLETFRRLEMRFLMREMHINFKNISLRQLRTRIMLPLFSCTKIVNSRPLCLPIDEPVHAWHGTSSRHSDGTKLVGLFDPIKPGKTAQPKEPVPEKIIPGAGDITLNPDQARVGLRVVNSGARAIQVRSRDGREVSEIWR